MMPDVAHISLVCTELEDLVAENVEKGETFLMRFPVPPIPEVREASMGKEWLETEATYEGLWDHKNVEELVCSQRLKVIYYDPRRDDHHIVGFAGFRWVNDAIGLSFTDNQDITWKETFEA